MIGAGRAAKTDEFSEKFQRGAGRGGSFSIQKYLLQILGTLNRALWAWNWKEYFDFVFEFYFPLSGR